MHRRLLGFAAAVIGAALTVLAPVTAASAAAPTVIDPACDEYSVGGFLIVADPVEAPPGLPPQVTIDDMSCIIVITQAGNTQVYAYLNDAFTKFLTITQSFVDAGWTVLEFEDGSDAGVPVDLASLPARIADDQINLGFRQGAINAAGITYATDINFQFGTGTFLFAVPLVGAPPAPTGDTFDDPSTISNLRTIADAVPSPGQGAVLVISAGLLTLLIAIPAFLVSKVLSSRYQQWFGWLERGRLGRFRKTLNEPTSTGRRWLFIAIGMILAALIAGFVDPRFGFNGLSIRLFFTLLATFALFNIGGWAVVTLVLKRLQPDAKPSLTFHPASILVVAVAVLLSRLLGFDPGIIFGLVAGTTFAVALARSREAAVIIAGSAYAAAIALIAWIAYSVMNAGGPSDNAFVIAVSEFLGGVTLEGVSTLPIALIPLATLEGGILFAWRRWVWAVCYVVGLVLFMLVLFNLPGGSTPVDGGFVRWLIVFGVFAVLATGVWLIDFLLRRRPVAAPEA
jgi:hypothetical protein